MPTDVVPLPANGARAAARHQRKTAFALVPEAIISHRPRAAQRADDTRVALQADITICMYVRGMIYLPPVNRILTGNCVQCTNIVRVSPRVATVWHKEKESFEARRPLAC
jgi:hypothetical protein